MFSSHPNNYGNDKHNVYTHVQKNNVKYVVPPFTPGGKVRVEFQFWIPITVSGFFINGRDLEAAMKSPNPTAYITALFFKHLATNSSISDILSNLESPVKIGVQNFLDRALPYLSHITSRDSVGAFTFKDEENVGNSRHKRSPEDADGWVTIGGEQSEAVTPRAPLLNHIPSSLAPAGQGPNNRVLWNGGDHHLSHNDISNSADKVRPSSQETSMS
ncbi:hypothetical protein OTU49_001279 [Cherax quadricarinatus]|uniref:Uncharacterized protein n=1 Tax=Cherax quadricarinatus TaxID=27406 RepID=A0AAW0XVX3_CHEQU